MKINLVYHSPACKGSGYMGSVGLYEALKANDLLHYAFNTTNGLQGLDVEKLNQAPIYFVRGMLETRWPILDKCEGTYRACWQSESYFTRHGYVDPSTPLMLKTQKRFNMIFVSSDTDVDLYNVPTAWLPSWADITVMNERCKPSIEGLGFVGSRKGREDFLDQDKEGIIKCVRAELKDNAFDTAVEYSRVISQFSMLVSPPGRCFNGMCGRAWEIMACKRLCFQYHNDDTMYLTKKYFNDGVDLVFFDSYGDLVDKYKYYLKHPREASAIALNGYRKVRLFHNQDVRAKYIVGEMEKACQ